MRIIQDCEKTHVVLEIVSFTSVQLRAHPCQLKEISKNKETDARFLGPLIACLRKLS